MEICRSNMKKQDFYFPKNTNPKKIQDLCRHQMIEKLLKDIRVDLEICRLEGLPPKEYIKMIKDIIDGLYYGEEK